MSSSTRRIFRYDRELGRVVEVVPVEWPFPFVAPVDSRPGISYTYAMDELDGFIAEQFRPVIEYPAPGG